MATQSFEEMYGRRVTVDVCHACHGVWLDGNELLQLSPAATLELFRTMAGAAGSPGPAAARAICPRCGLALQDTSDMQRSTRFFYRRCPRGDGRFMTFFQFLRAKNFVRSLSEAEVRDLRRHVRQINCSNCGAPVDVERGATCAHCGTPISILDPEQVQKTALELQRADDKRRAPDPSLPLTLMLERLKAERAFQEATGSPRPTGVFQGGPADLIDLGLATLRRWFEA
jgi:Zn-finger nucleic acid-binding protein